VETPGLSQQLGFAHVQLGVVGREGEPLQQEALAFPEMAGFRDHVVERDVRNSALGIELKGSLSGLPGVAIRGGGLVRRKIDLDVGHRQLRPADGEATCLSWSRTWSWEPQSGGRSQARRYRPTVS
jgi:hypothetical protein